MKDWVVQFNKEVKIFNKQCEIPKSLIELTFTMLDHIGQFNRSTFAEHGESLLEFIPMSVLKLYRQQPDKWNQFKPKPRDVECFKRRAEANANDNEYKTIYEEMKKKTTKRFKDYFSFFTKRFRNYSFELAIFNSALLWILITIMALFMIFDKPGVSTLRIFQLVNVVLKESDEARNDTHRPLPMPWYSEVKFYIQLFTIILLLLSLPLLWSVFKYFKKRAGNARTSSTEGIKSNPISSMVGVSILKSSAPVSKSLEEDTKSKANKKKKKKKK